MWKRITTEQMISEISDNLLDITRRDYYEKCIALDDNKIKQLCEILDITENDINGARIEVFNHIDKVAYVIKDRG